MQINATRARYEKLGCICVEFRTYYMNHQSEIGIEIKKARLKGFSDQMQYRKSVQLETKYYICL